MKPRLMALLILIFGGFLGVTAWQWVGDDPSPPSASFPTGQEPSASVPGPSPAPIEVSPPAPSTSPPPTRVAYVVSHPGTPLRGADADTATPIAGGILLPVLEETGDGYRVFDSCNREGFVPADQVDEGLVPGTPGGSFDQSVFVIDPGHGIPDYGAVGPSGLTETEANLDVASRVAELLGGPRDVDWASGEVTPGREVPAAAAAVLTRHPDGPNGGEYELGLRFRTTVANAMDATALVSIHHNSGPEAHLDHPGSEAFVSVSDPESPRLGGLVVEELRESLSRFDADWMGTAGPGLFTRVNAEGDDYYSILARSEVPAAIVEGAYISNPSEEALAKTDEFRQAYANAVYRALVRFVTTDDYPIAAPEPELWEPDRPGPSVADCQVPAP